MLAAQGAADNIRPEIANLAGMLFDGPGNWAEAQRRLGNVPLIPATFSTKTQDTSNPNDIIVYCNLNRLNKSKRKDGAWYDSATKSYEVIPNDDWLMCKTGQAIAGQSRPKTITSNNRAEGSTRTVLVSIDLCNWYLEHVKNSEWATASDVESGSSTFPFPFKFLNDLGQKTLTALNRFGKTDMDTFALFEHTLLHELTHSRVVGVSQAALRLREAYGWDKCLEAKAAANSDSLAFFALGCWLIHQGYTIDVFGNVGKPS